MNEFMFVLGCAVKAIAPIAITMYVVITAAKWYMNRP